MTGRRKPDYEAVEVEVRADTIDERGYFPRRKSDGGNGFTAEGNIDVEVRKQHPGAVDKTARPDRGTHLCATGRKTKIVVESRRVEKKKHRAKDGREVATASGSVGIFGKLRRSKE